MKQWQRGKKKLTPTEKIESDNRQRERVRIANLVARKPEIENKCCICGKKGQILHNTEDPYYIAFICAECRKDPNNLLVAEENRFDIRNILNKNKLSVENFTDQEVIRIVIGYMNDMVSIGDYCNKVGISRHQFNQLIEKYHELLPKQPIKQLIKNKAMRLKNEQLKKMTEQRTLNRL